MTPKFLSEQEVSCSAGWGGREQCQVGREVTHKNPGSSVSVAARRLVASNQSCRCLVSNRIIIYCWIDNRSCNCLRNQNLKFLCQHTGKPLPVGKSI